jgi:hypothetical protein
MTKQRESRTEGSKDRLRSREVDMMKARKAKRKVVPGIELGLPESESDVLTITLYNHLIVPNSDLSNYNQQR